MRPLPRIGDEVAVELSVENRGPAAARCNVDLRVHFVKASGRTSAKVFKVGVLDLGPGGRQPLSKRISLRQHSTRKHHPGEHRVEAIVNGSTRPLGSFTIEPASAEP